MKGKQDRKLTWNNIEPVQFPSYQSIASNAYRIHLNCEWLLGILSEIFEQFYLSQLVVLFWYVKGVRWFHLFRDREGEQGSYQQLLKEKVFYK